MTPFTDLPAFPHHALAADRAAAGANASGTTWMQRGAALHQAGLPEYALLAFEAQLAQRPGDQNAASACAAVLGQMGRRQAAYRTLLAHRQALEATADGACNLAYGAALNGDLPAARTFYALALRRDASHLRSLAGMSQVAVAEGAWDEALPLAVKCAALQPQDLPSHLQLVDMLLQARRPSDALRAAKSALEWLPGTPALRLRQGVAEACLGAWDSARQSLSAVDITSARQVLRRHGVLIPEDAQALDAVALYIQYACLTMDEAEWLYEKALPELLRALLRTPHAATSRAWQAARVAAPGLALDDREIAAIHTLADASHAGGARSAPPALRLTGDGRLRIGLFVPRLSRPGAAQWVADQLAWHDTQRFALHVYAHTPQPEARWAAPLLPRVTQFVETAHMTDEELLTRLQLDALDLLVDLSTDTADARPAVMAHHPATVVLRDGVRFPNQPPGPCDYALSEAFLHPGVAAGAVVRLPYSGAIAPPAPSAPAFARAAGDPFTLGADVAPNAIDPQTFAAWMQVLVLAPGSRLCLPGYAASVQARLHRNAKQHGVEAGRVQFAPAGTAMLEGLALHTLPDLLLDPLRRSTPGAVARALAAGIPAVAWEGGPVHSRQGAAILQAAGLHGAIAEDVAAYVRLAAGLAQDPAAAAELRAQLVHARTSAPWWDAAARTREREAAWLQMIERARAGQPPAPFDIQAAS